MGATEVRTVRVGEAFELAFDANPTTGYDWQVSFPPDLLRLQRREHVRSSDRIGAGGRTKFTWLALGPGEAELRFRYRRVWEGTAVEERVVRVRITR